MTLTPRPLPAMTTALLIEREPNNLQAQSLNQLIEKGVARGEYDYRRAHPAFTAHCTTLC